MKNIFSPLKEAFATLEEFKTHLHICRDSSSFKTSFKRHVIGLSFEVYNSFLPQLASKLQAVESRSPKKVPGKGAFYYINYHNSGTFLDLQIQQLAILKPVEVGKSNIPQKKAL